MYEIRDYDFDKQRRVLRKKGFIWCAYFLAYMNKSEDFYKQIEEAWTDLDSCTDKSIAFLISMEAESVYEKFVEKMKHVEYRPTDRKHTIAETNTLLLSKAKEMFNIQEEQLPCLLFFNLLEMSNNPIVVPLGEDTRIFEIMQYIMIRTRRYQKRLESYADDIKRMGLRKIETYLDMEKRLIDISWKNEFDVEFIKRTLSELPNSYAAERLIEYWKMNRKSMCNKMWGDDDDSTLVDKIIDVRSKIGDNFTEKKRRYDEIYKSVVEMNVCIQSIVENIDTSRCKEDVICYAKEWISEVESEISKDEKCEYVEIVYEAKDIIDKLSRGDSVLDEIKNWKERYRNSEATKLVDDISRLVFLYDLFNLLVEWMR